jgi:hypothetical protein
MKSITIEKGPEFAAFLNRIYLGGTIEEAVLKFDKDGTVSCQAVDLSNAVCVSQTAEVGSDTSLTIGVANLATLTKFFNKDGQFDASMTDLKMTVKRKGHGQASFQLIEPEEVATAIKEVDMKDKCNSKAKIELKGGKVDDLLGYFSLLSCESVVFRAKGGKLFAESPSSDSEQFKLPLGKIKGEFRVVTYVKHIANILKETKSDDKLQLMLEEDSALAFVQNDQYWLIAPIEE